MKHLCIDIETYSDEDIGKTGLFRYAQSEVFEVLLFAYAVDFGDVHVVDLTAGEAIPMDIMLALTDPEVHKHAYNAAFELYCIGRHVLHMSDDDIAEWAYQWGCTMLAGQYCGHPAGLAAVGEALGLPDDAKKDRIGKALIRYFCIPCKPTKTNGGRLRNLPEHDPGKWELFIEYNRQDVVTEMAVYQKLNAFPVPEAVRMQWVLDQQINIRGVQVDVEMLEGAIAIDAQNNEALKAESARLTGLDNPNSNNQLAGWLSERLGRPVESLDKAAVEALLSGDLDDTTRTVLENRQKMAKTSNKKYKALADAVGRDGRVRGMMAFYGANRTGREAGRIFQPQNLPHDTVPDESLGRELVKAQSIDGLRLAYGHVSRTLSALIRTVLVAKPGHKFIDADFSAIEARVVAWLSGEDWVLDVFRTHGKIYEATASQMFGVPIEKIKKGSPEYSYRAKGKVATLALGYQGGPGALINMGALNSGLTEEELPDIVARWRASNAKTVAFWGRVEEAARTVTIRGGMALVPVSDGRALVFRREKANGLDFMTIELPSRRKLFYASPTMTVNRFGNPSLGYMGQVGQARKWGVAETYGGKLTENITQAVARDCLFYAMEKLTEAGYKIVFDIHDEVVLEAPDGTEQCLEDVVRIMSQSPPWAPSLPLTADGWEGGYFRKD